MAKQYFKGMTSLPFERYFPKVTEKAVCVTIVGGYTSANDRNEWFPKSQIIIGEPNDVGNAEIFIPCWLFRSKDIGYNDIREIEFVDVVEL